MVNMDQIPPGFDRDPAGIKPAEVDVGEVKFGGREKAQPWGGGGSYVALRKEVSISDDTCSWGDAPKATADVQVCLRKQ